MAPAHGCPALRPRGRAKARPTHLSRQQRAFGFAQGEGEQGNRARTSLETTGPTGAKTAGREPNGIEVPVPYRLRQGARRSGVSRLHASVERRRASGGRATPGRSFQTATARRRPDPAGPGGASPRIRRTRAARCARGRQPREGKPVTGGMGREPPPGGNSRRRRSRVDVVRRGARDRPSERKLRTTQGPFPMAKPATGRSRRRDGISTLGHAKRSNADSSSPPPGSGPEEHQIWSRPSGWPDPGERRSMPIRAASRCGAQPRR